MPPQLIAEVQAADQAYQTALHYGAWEDARLRYMRLLESEVLSVRVLAKNRLEFISDWQRNPPTITTAMSPQQGTGLQPTYNREPWVPGTVADARPKVAATTASAPVPVKDVTIKPNQPAVTTSNPGLNIPVPPPQGPAATYQPPPPSTVQAAPTQTAPVAGPLAAQAVVKPPPANGQVPMNVQPQQPQTAAATAPGRVKVVGRISRTVQNTYPNQLYYLTDSKGLLTYYARGVTSSGVKLADFDRRIVEIEGTVVQVSIEGRQQQQINVDKVRLLQ